jgi:predicted metal-dependent phosphoesterase TrpH
MIDLHVHSSCSDGTYSPAEIARLAGEKKLTAVALTDHDSVRGIREFMESGRNYPQTEFIPGVEISSVYGSRELHFVGLYIDYENEEFLAFLEKMRQGRLLRNIGIAGKLASLGYPIDTEILDYVHDLCYTTAISTEQDIPC